LLIGPFLLRGPAASSQSEVNMTTPKPAADDLVRGLDQYCEILGCSRPTVSRLVESGQLPGSKIGNSYVTTRQALLEAVAKMGQRHAA
jgi:excisionase family DNA binding protein